MGSLFQGGHLLTILIFFPAIGSRCFCFAMTITFSFAASP